MKKILLITLIALTFSCSNRDEDCDAKKQEINAYYDKEVINAGSDSRKIRILNEERNSRLANAC